MWFDETTGKSRCVSRPEVNEHYGRSGVYDSRMRKTAWRCSKCLSVLLWLALCLGVIYALCATIAYGNLIELPWRARIDLSTGLYVKQERVGSLWFTTWKAKESTYFKEYFLDAPKANWRVVQFGSSEWYATSGLGRLLSEGTLLPGGYPPGSGISEDARPDLISRVLNLLQHNPDAALQYVCKVYELSWNRTSELETADLPIVRDFLLHDFLPDNNECLRMFEDG